MENSAKTFRLIRLLSDTEYNIYTICLTVLAKFCVSITYFAINLQALETYPTCLRQSGISVGMIIANVFGICGPYINYLVKYYP